MSTGFVTDLEIKGSRTGRLEQYNSREGTCLARGPPRINPQYPKGVIPECRARINTQALLGKAPTKTKELNAEGPKNIV